MCASETERKTATRVTRPDQATVEPQEITLVTLFQTLHTLSYIAGDRVADRLQALKDDEKGASAVEYGILVGILALAIVALATAFGGRLSSLFAGIKLS